MQIFIGSQEEYYSAVKNRLHHGNELVLQNNQDYVLVHTDVTVGKNGRCSAGLSPVPVTVTAKDNGSVLADGKTSVIAGDSANVVAKGNCKLTLKDSAFATCSDHCHVTLEGASRALADGQCAVDAYGESSVAASGSCKVHSHQNVTAKGSGVTSITAKDSCIVYATDSCTVHASDSCLVVADKNAKITMQDNCLVMSNGSPDISLSDKCEHLDLDGVTDKNIMGALKQIAQTKAAIERPYVAIQILKENIPESRKELVNRCLGTMGLRDQVATKNYIYGLAGFNGGDPAQGFDRQLETAHRAGYVQGVCECAAVVGSREKNLGKKLLTEMNVSKDMAEKYAAPETYKTLEKTFFAPSQGQKLERTHGVRR